MPIDLRKYKDYAYVEVSGGPKGSTTGVVFKGDLYHIGVGVDRINHAESPVAVLSKTDFEGYEKATLTAPPTDFEFYVIDALKRGWGGATVSIRIEMKL